MFTDMYHVLFVSRRSYHRAVCGGVIWLTSERDMYRNTSTISRSVASSQPNRMTKRNFSLYPQRSVNQPTHLTAHMHRSGTYVFAFVSDCLMREKSEGSVITLSQWRYLDALIHASLPSRECARLPTQMRVHTATGAAGKREKYVPPRGLSLTRDFRNGPR
jgi:hypothetical protein